MRIEYVDKSVRGSIRLLAPDALPVLARLRTEPWKRI